MARISISKVLESRKRVRLATVLATFLLVFALIEGLILNNPKNSRAAISESGYTITLGKSAGENRYFLIAPNGDIYEYRISDFKDGDSKNIKITYASASGFSGKTGKSITNKNVIISDGARVTFAGGKIKLKSMQVNSGAILTHLGSVDNENRLHMTNNMGCFSDTFLPQYVEATNCQSILTNSGLVDSGGKILNVSNIGINLEIAGDFKLDNWAKINVNERGYRAGENGDSGNGPGGGKSGGSSNAGSGGSHGGLGGWSLQESFNKIKLGTEPSQTNDTISDPSLAGSGGAGWDCLSGNNGEHYDFGSGGGVVIIKASNITLGGINSILASGNSSDYNNMAETSRNKCGGGAGGTINLKATNKMTIRNDYDILVARGGQSKTSTNEKAGDGGGGRIALNASEYSMGSLSSEEAISKLMIGASPYTSNSNVVVLNAREPLKTADYLTDLKDRTLSERGTIYVGGGVSSSITIKKTLIAGDRSGSINFNPYSLQKDDLITVKLEISNPSQGSFTLEDKLLKTNNASNNYTCKPNGIFTAVPSNSSVKPLDTNADPLVWQLDGSTKSVSYQCQVQ